MKGHGLPGLPPIQNPFVLAYPEIMKIRKNNMNINVNAGDFDSTFVIPEGFKQEEQ